MPTITTNDGVQLYYEDVGEGRPLLLIPGWTCTHHFFQKNIAALAQSCRVIAPDMRAHGDSAKVVWGHRIARYAKDVKDLLRPCVWNTSRCSDGPWGQPFAGVTWTCLGPNTSRATSVWTSRRASTTTTRGAGGNRAAMMPRPWPCSPSVWNMTREAWPGDWCRRVLARPISRPQTKSRCWPARSTNARLPCGPISWPTTRTWIGGICSHRSRCRCWCAWGGSRRCSRGRAARMWASTSRVPKRCF